MAETGQDFLGRGWAFPVKLIPDQLGSFLGGDEKIRQSIWIILSTAAGERQMRPEFGCGIHDLVFAPNTAALRGLVQAKVRDALTRWEPRIDLLDVSAGTDEAEPTRLLIQIEYQVRATNNRFNLVYPFYVE